jgi:hypothetical protein
LILKNKNKKNTIISYKIYIFYYLPDSAKQYSDDVNFALEVRKLPALAFIPVDKVIQSFEILLESTYYAKNEEVITPNNLF